MDIKLVFRKMTETDLELTMNWRMQDDVTRFMETNPKLTIEKQKIWFQKQEKDPNAYYWIVEIDNIKSGVVSIIMDSSGKLGETSAYIAEKRNQSFPNMLSVIASLIDYYFDELKAEILYGEIFTENKGVVMLNKHLGYKVEGVVADAVEKEGKKYDVMKLSMSKGSWYNRRKEINYVKAKVINERNFLSKCDFYAIKKKANLMRKDIFKMALSAGDAGLHFGGTLSLIEIIASLYFYNMNFKENPHSDLRDRLIMSKGHGVPAIYVALKQLGILSEKELMTFKNDKTELYGHPSMNPRLGIEFSSGSLGQGLSLAVGSAIALKKKGNDAKVYVILGDGECNEGSIWESVASASHYNLNNIMAIIDRNHLQYDGVTESIMDMESIEEKFNSFGWETHVIDGHRIESCCKAFTLNSDRPIAVIANTVKGKGISFMENDPKWHHGRITIEQYKKAIEELNHDIF